MARKRIEHYLLHRELLGYDKMTEDELYNVHPIGKPTFERFVISRMDETLTSNNVHVIVQKLKGTNLNEIMKVIPLSHVIHSYFMFQDMFGRVIAKTENRTGKPSSVVCILDLDGVNLADFLNPLSAPVKLARLVVKIWADYFSEHLCKLILINPPGLVSLMWKISKYVMDAETAAKLCFLDSVEDLKKYLHPNVIPVEFGGDWIDSSGFADPPESCCKSYIPVEKGHYRTQEQVWSDNGVLKPPPMKTSTIKSHQKLDIELSTKEEGTLIWNFTSSGDVEFEILRVENGKEIPVWPKITVTSLKLSEFGSVQVSPGHFILRFVNPSSTWFAVKLHCAAEIKHKS
ncbi:hypothetical protein WR25_25483 isoform B [Diploscapter pachys]|nr:hypothetical protein WR25_25483 isoform B [Diploscapter pachys]